MTWYMGIKTYRKLTIVYGGQSLATFLNSDGEKWSGHCLTSWTTSAGLAPAALLLFLSIREHFVCQQNVAALWEHKHSIIKIS